MTATLPERVRLLVRATTRLRAATLYQPAGSWEGRVWDAVTAANRDLTRLDSLLSDGGVNELTSGELEAVAEAEQRAVMAVGTMCRLVLDP